MVSDSNTVRHMFMNTRQIHQLHVFAESIAVNSSQQTDVLAAAQRTQILIALTKLDI